MNIVIIFIAFSVISICAQIVFLLKNMIHKTKEVKSIPITAREKAYYLVGLAVSGDIRKHTIVNKSNPYNDQMQYEAYRAFLNKKSVETLRNLKGDSPFVEY